MMPHKAMTLGTWYAVAMTALATSLLSAAAADLETSSRLAKGWVDTFGILPMMALAAFLAMGFALWKSYQFTTNTLVNLVERAIRTDDRLIQAIKASPCGINIPDSDEVEMTPRTKTLEAIRRRDDRKAKREAE